MRVLETLRVALDAVVANKMRSLLTMLGVIIGIAAVITMVALGEGAQRSVEEWVRSMGTNVLTVRPGQDLILGGPEVQRLVELLVLGPVFRRRVQLQRHALGRGEDV